MPASEGDVHRFRPEAALFRVRLFNALLTLHTWCLAIASDSAPRQCAHGHHRHRRRKIAITEIEKLGSTRTEV